MKPKFEPTEEFFQKTQPIPGYSAYRIENNGAIYSMVSVGGMLRRSRLTDKWRRLSHIESQGRYFVGLIRDDGVKHRRPIHQLVLETYVGPRPSQDIDGLHWDDDPKNNHVGNLRWGTVKDNYCDWVRNGGGVHGSKNRMAKLSELDITVIRKLCSSGHQHHKIADLFGVCRSNISFISQRKTWSHI